MSTKQAFRLISLAVAGAWLLYQPGVVRSQSVPEPAEVQLQGAPFADVKAALFGPPGMGLLNGGAAFELQAQDVAVPKGFFTSAMDFNMMDFVTLVQKVQSLPPGTEVKLQGTVDGVPFQAKVEGGEVKVQGLSLTQAQFNALFNNLKGVNGIREVKVAAVVNGVPMVAKFENEGGKIETKVETKDESRRRAKDGGRDLDRDIRGRELAVEGEKAGRADRPERLGRVRRDEMIEKIDRPERIGRMERLDRIERPQRIERFERPERIERLDHHDR